MGMLDHLFAYVDAFVASDMSKNGFGITYDFRALRLPSMNMIMRVGEWGSLPERKSAWEVKNLTSSVVVSSGMAFAMSKAALVGFFYICPPIVRTYLLFDPSEDKETACFFDPLPKQTCPATDAVRPEDEAKDARKPDVKTLKESWSLSSIGVGSSDPRSHLFSRSLFHTAHDNSSAW